MNAPHRRIPAAAITAALPAAVNRRGAAPVRPTASRRLPRPGALRRRPRAGTARRCGQPPGDVTATQSRHGAVRARHRRSASPSCARSTLPLLSSASRVVDPSRMNAPEQPPITKLLGEWRNGDLRALDRLVPLVYSDLHRLAERHLRREGPVTLDATELLHEAC